MVSTISIYHYIRHCRKTQPLPNQTKYSTRRFHMLSFLKKIFGATVPDQPAAPYKVESTAPQVPEFPFPTAQPVSLQPKPAAKKLAAKTKPVRKPRTPKV